MLLLGCSAGETPEFRPFSYERLQELKANSVSPKVIVYNK